MRINRLSETHLGKKEGLWIWFLILLIAAIFGRSIVSLPFPQNLALLFGLPMLAVIWYNMRVGIILWFVLSAVGNMFEVDLPGVPPLRTAHMILLMLLAVWVIQSYKEIPSEIARFLRTGKNRVLLLLLGWITLSMVMGRITGVTQQSYEYQFNAWMSIVLAIALALFVSNYFNERLLKSIILVSVILGTILTGAVLVSGFSRGVDLLEWKTYYYEFLSETFLIIISPLFLAILYFPEQRWWGRFLFSVAILLSMTLNILLILSGSRSHLFFFVTLVFLLFFTRPRLFTALALLMVLPVMALNMETLKSWKDEQMGYAITRQGVITGKGTRIALAQDAIQIIRQYPLWGTGTDFYRQYSGVYFRDKETGKLFGGTTAHNTWLQTAVDHGIPAAVLLAIFFVYVWKDTMFLYRRMQDNVEKKYVLLFLAEFCTTIIGSPLGEAVLPVFTGSGGGEAAALAPYLVGFWLNYGIVLGIENLQKKQSQTMISSSASHE